MAKNKGISSKSPHFFRIILPQILQNGTLELPRNFVKDHGQSLSKYVDLKLPTGAKSKMELKYCDGRAWLDKGWRDFVGKYSIKCGYFLVFKYKGESRFNVRIFDLSTSEIEYPASSLRTSNKKAEKHKLKEIKEGDCDDKDKILHQSPLKVQKSKGIKNIVHSRKLRSELHLSHFGNKLIEGEGIDYTSARDIVLEKAKAFQSSNPRFIAVIRPSSIVQGYVHVPAVFARSYIHGRDENGVKINGPNGRAWFMEYVTAGPLRHHQVSIISGWREFMEEYRLRVGDVCVFEMVDTTVLTFNVTIFQIAIQSAIEEDVGRITRSQKKLKSSVLDV